MNKIQYHKKINNLNYYNNYNNYYNGFSYKKFYSKNNNINKQNNTINYNEEWRRNTFYNNNNFDNQYNDYMYTLPNKKKRFLKYNNNYYNFDDNISQETMSRSTNETKEKNNELITVKINFHENQFKELIIYKNDDLFNLVYNFCYDNSIDKKLVLPLCNKIKASLNIVNNITNNSILNKEDLMIIQTAKNMTENV